MRRHCHDLARMGTLTSAAIIGFLGSTAVLAADRDSRTGSSTAQIVAPLQVAALADLRFGRFFQPTSTGNLTISSLGLVIGTAGMAPAVTTPQNSGGRGPASFQVTGEAGRFFRAGLPGRIDIANGSATMRVSNFTTNVPSRGIALTSAGSFTMTVGARLQVAASQAVGNYSGTFDVTVSYD